MSDNTMSRILDEERALVMVRVQEEFERRLSEHRQERAESSSGVRRDHLDALTEELQEMARRLGITLRK